MHIRIQCRGDRFFSLEAETASCASTVVCEHWQRLQKRKLQIDWVTAAEVHKDGRWPVTVGATLAQFVRDLLRGLMRPAIAGIETSLHQMAKHRRAIGVASTHARPR